MGNCYHPGLGEGKGTIGAAPMPGEHVEKEVVLLPGRC